MRDRSPGACAAIVPAALTLLLLAMPAHAAGGKLPDPPANGEMGFVFNSFTPSVYQGKDDCPDGPSGTLRESFLNSLPIGEQDRLRLKANEEEYTARLNAYAVGPNNTNICTNPQLFDRPPIRTLKGKIAYGLDLDGDAADGATAASGCSHENFRSPAGEAGIDNQFWRVMGCRTSVRGVEGSTSDSARGLNGFLISGEHSQVLLLRGVDSLVDDPQVEVIYANTEDRAIVDGKQQFIPGASFTVTSKPQYRNVLRGRIVAGVLTTEPADLRLKQTWGQSFDRDIRGARTEWNLRHARLRLAFQPDGTIKGLVGGYQPLWNTIQSPSIGGVGSATTAGYDCAGIYKTLQLMADGDRDPKTGQCTTISTSIDAAALPAFVNDRPPVQKSAAK